MKIQKAYFSQELLQMVGGSPSLAISLRVQRKYSKTYGGRNTPEKQYIDSLDLRVTVDSNFDALKPGLIEEGYSVDAIEGSRQELHRLNIEQGWY